MKLRTKLLMVAAIVAANMTFAQVARADYSTEDGGSTPQGVCDTCYDDKGQPIACCTKCGLLDTCNCTTAAGCG